VSPAVFCDALNWRSAIALARARAPAVHVLDDVTPTRSSRLARKILALARCDVVATRFFAGHLRGAGGEPLYVLAGRRSSQAALDAARAAIAESPTLASINDAFGRDRVVLRIARQVWLALGRQVLQIHVAERLSEAKRAVLWLARPTRYDPRVLCDISATVEVRFYDAVNPLLERARVAAWPIELGARQLYFKVVSLFSAQEAGLKDPQGRPGVLLVQEDEASPDHSYRTQPHWFPAAEEPPLPFATYLIGGGPLPEPRGAAVPPGLTVLNARALGRIERVTPGDALTARLERDARRSMWMAFSARADWVRAAGAIAARLLLRARVMAKTCRCLKIRAFLSGEPYLFDSDAVHVVSRDLDVNTVTFQYSNLAYPNVILASTSDRMLLFSERYARMWSTGGIGPREFTATGYPFDGAFARVRGRAAELRAGLESAGARFVISYFDENVGPPKYGFIEPEEFDAEIRSLAQRVLDDPTLGIIFKSQFRKRSPTIRLADDPVLAAAIRTGRMVDLYTGVHRNIVLPAEAALASDLALSQIIGATAALESALAGTRCVLVNFNGVKTANDELYARGLVVFDSFESVMDAIARYRAGDARYAALGDWSSFLHELDPFRDGASAVRLRAVLEEAACGQTEGGERQPRGQEAHA
jgi:hypothetical protein